MFYWWQTTSIPNFKKDSIIHPLLIPPFQGINRGTVHEHRKVKMVSSREACHATSAEFLAFFN